MKAALAGVLMSVACAVTQAATPAPIPTTTDPRMQEQIYDGKSVITVLVRKGQATHIQLDPTDRIGFAATGVGADCAKADDSWCIAALPNTTDVFVKPRSTAKGSNNLAITTPGGAYSFRFLVLGPDDPRAAAVRLTIYRARPEIEAALARQAAESPPRTVPVLPAPPNPREIVAERLTAAPRVVNRDYAIAVGDRSDDIVPSLVFDDGRQTYLKFGGNREIPSVFHVGDDGTESSVNTRMDGELLAVDRVARRLYLRMGQQVVLVVNEAFDAAGVPPANGTTVAGVERALKPAAARELHP